MLHRLRTKAQGFTLIELLIVVAIIGILAAIAIPNFLSASNKSKYARAFADTKLMVSQASIYNNDNNAFPTLAQLMGGNYMSYARDPFTAAANVCTAASTVGCYQYTQGTATTPTSAHTIGANAGDDNAAWAGTAALVVDDAGVSSQLGCSVGPTVPTGVRC